MKLKSLLDETERRRRTETLPYIMFNKMWNEDEFKFS